MRPRSRIAALGTLLLVAPVAAACTGGGSSSSTPAGGAKSNVAAVTATRWWSNSAAQAGSAIDPAHPLAVAGKLQPSTADYCGMLQQTVAAGRSILPGVTAADPALLAATQAFVGELERVAPAEVAGSWRVLGGVVLQVVRSGGDVAKVKGVDRVAVQRAAGTVASHAQRTCHVDVSRVGS